MKRKTIAGNVHSNKYFSTQMISGQRLPLGSRVRIHGLQSPRGVALNQHFGVVIGWHENHQRYKVMLDNSSLTGFFLPQNLSHEERKDGLTFVDLLSGGWNESS
jgi:hypothetical protein